VYCGRKFSLKTVLMLADQMVITGDAIRFYCIRMWFFGLDDEF